MSDDYFGPALWIRIQHRFGPRMMEWFMAWHMLAAGYVFLLPSNMFDDQLWVIFRSVFRSEDFLGWLLVSLGSIRIMGLIVNGMKERVTPQIRQISAGVGCLIWGGFSYCFACSGVIGLWISVYPLFVVLELINIYRAARDQGGIDNAARAT